MEKIAFIMYQCFLFILLLLTNLFLSPFIKPPLSYIDLVAGVLQGVIWLIVIYFITVLYKRSSMRLRNKVFCSITSFILAIIFIVALENIWFEIKGEMLFNVLFFN
ncbi:hypothetical protein AJ85_15125 [Alkalihalobacillus alcalophilus ATCC 27647 = CGMCC 1.3604]|uniref:Uncharacterized protein n=1 Tax=Alkalihalobacillus alcalophilus ATCC 27647 = CGMCC 1.3604 TaxID=1218173 RepID=A0A094WMN3_ALKAL|nr:hypothetical protein [Alkalihalobacillus alcalophilus]KGA99024.1 hypothetical protein BALCAV_0200915 [Alkalihalobacillus alcalophilus ATCC 27647 = CGMCC 1.3604]MED1560667.1 hypothetical protein [Alkalihalobacillus alcalophilus]THG89835.1 hypothetical protein AJ85_15125 [Alkalihalobacillus alcalophilus ATCC 27647 = CGMCC 1.3604]